MSRCIGGLIVFVDMGCLILIYSTDLLVSVFLLEFHSCIVVSFVAMGYSRLSIKGALMYGALGVLGTVLVFLGFAFSSYKMVIGGVLFKSGFPPLHIWLEVIYYTVNRLGLLSIAFLSKLGLLSFVLNYNLRLEYNRLSLILVYLGVFCIVLVWLGVLNTSSFLRCIVNISIASIGVYMIIGVLFPLGVPLKMVVDVVIIYSLRGLYGRNTYLYYLFSVYSMTGFYPVSFVFFVKIFLYISLPPVLSVVIFLIYIYFSTISVLSLNVVGRKGLFEGGILNFLCLILLNFYSLVILCWL
uniref:NADH dehydrogenase subunit 2 n=1 Tax=Polypodium hydriforme TaxID=43186 RepID=UPI002114FCEB|nr:NADH dehydrogenase subunit 2 [Polypodium hydriforme]USZ79607.1 NADH dehydrogenase subunit 2 [Polypodium hydriforme]